jgi:hypothetical protein
MLTRRHTLPLAVAGLAALSACGGREEPVAAAPTVTGYGHLTPLRLNVAEIEVAPPAEGAVQVAPPATARPEREMARMAEDRLRAVGITGTARFVVDSAVLTRAALPQSGGWFSRDPGERLSCTLRCRVEVLSGEGRRIGFAEAEARRTRTLEDGASNAARARAMEELLRQTMDDLNVEFEYQLRRNLRAWLMDTLPSGPAGGTPVEREDLPQG